MGPIRSFLSKISHIFCAVMLVMVVFVPTHSFANTFYDCGVGEFPMRFAGCRPGYYYEDWQDADDTLGPDDVGECLECPDGMTCVGGFAGPAGVVCQPGYHAVNNECVALSCGANESVFGNSCQVEKFSVTTTSGTTDFGFYLSASGTFYIDWGDGTYQKINRSDTTVYTKYEHHYASSGTYTVRFAGVATGYNNSAPTIVFNEEAVCHRSCDLNYAENIASISGSLGALFPTIGNNLPSFDQTFSGASNLTSIPATLFSGITTGANSMFSHTFYGCTGLTSIPGNLFSGITTGADYMFISTFSGCTSLQSIPGNLFSGITTGANGMFQSTFSGCTGLTSIPSGLFSNITTGANSMFYSTFDGCTGLQSIPGNLFSGITTGANYMFTSTFSGCTSLQSIPGNLFSRITTGANYMFENTFWGCTGLTEIPGNLFSGITTGAIYMFQSTFSGCTGLTSIPSGLFSNITTGAGYMFSNTFLDCTGLTSIPGNLFSGITTGANYMFYYTFYGCTGLTSIPGNLFGGITTGAYAMFSNTFRGCTGLTEIPGNLFSGITTGAIYMFQNTFYNCTNLAGYIPPTTFAGLIAAGHPAASDMWYKTFYNTKLATSCPAGNPQYITGYEGTNTSTAWGGKVSCGCAGGQYINNNGCSACANTKPENATWDANPTTATCPWTCNSGYINTGSACESAKFSVTTTSDATTLSWTMSATGTFYANCGDGGTLTQSGTTTGSTISGNTITRTGTDATTYTCTWGSAGAHTVQFAGTATNYNTGTTTAAISFYKSSGGTQAKIASVSGNMSAMFPYITGNATNGAQPRFFSTFSGATNLAEISNTLFSNYTTGATNMFKQAFSGCTGLQSIPSGMFSNVTTGANGMFYSTFNGCTGLTSISAGLFSNVTTGASEMFRETFKDCTGLQTISGNLFSGVTTTTGAVSMFNSTFSGCTSLQSIPSDMFSGITTGADYMFTSTFSGCTSLQSIPGNLFSRITTGANYLFGYTFSGCTGLQSIPAGLFSGITAGAESMFNGTFRGCTNLSGYIPTTTFAGLIANGHPSVGSMWSYTFENTNLATSCPAGTGQYITGYESSQWGYSNGNTSTSGTNRVSCEPCSGTLPANASYIPNTCEIMKFSVTTTSDATSLVWTMTAVGTFYANCGDGGTLSQSTSVYGTTSGNTITRTGTPEITYTCTWGSAGAHTVNFGGTATNYSTNTSTAAISFYKSSGGTQAKIASVSGNLSSMFPYISGKATNGAQPRFYQTFYGATNLTSVPDTLFADYTTGANYMFSGTFNGCTGLTSIPAELFSGITTGAQYMFTGTFNGCTGLQSLPSGLFSGITTGAINMFSYTFNGCTGLQTIPGNLFSGITTGANSMFSYTFNGCTGLQTIPGNLFSGITTGANSMFYSTFQGCTGLTSLPSGLFSGITTVATNMFYNTFWGCTNLAGYIPPGTFAGLIAAGHPTESNMWQNTFTNTNVATSCASYSGTTQYITGYEGSTNGTTWNGKVSCYTPCSTGYYGMDSTCTACSNTKPSNSSYSGTAITNTCPWECDAGYYNNNGICTQCSAGTYSAGGAASCTACTGATYSDTDGAASCTNCPTATALASRVTGYWYYMSSGVHDTINGCRADITEMDSTGDYSMSCGIVNGDYGVTASPYSCMAGQVTSCAAGRYSPWSNPNANIFEKESIAAIEGTVCVDAGAGYYSPAGDLNRYACTNGPANSSYTGSAATNACPWACDAGYTEYSNACHAMCPNNKMLHVGNISYPAFADNTNVLGPMLHIKDENNQMCYVFVEPDAGKTGSALKILYNNTVYRAIDPR